MVNGEALTDGKVAISGVTDAQIAQNTEGKQDGAKLYIDNAKNEQSYTILDGNVTSKWSDDNVVSDNILLGFSSGETANTYTARYQNVKDIFGETVVADELIDKTLQTMMKNKNQVRHINSSIKQQVIIII